ncbi:hypothetical protein [Actinoalloteichus caeruleus]|uniref:hypothetical protein n=1 Tax=Actinoalloteichus cyanogriseus TaxID=2893586 RepID=UPI001B807D32|nr:hypothetical protein [Actinoalloteichus caeruleus]
MVAASVASLSAMDGVATASGMAVGAGPGAPRVLPVRTELAALLPWGGLRRGSTVAVRGSTALLLSLLAEATTAGSWAAVVGMPAVGVLAAAEAGVAVRRMPLVPDPGPDLPGVVGALLDGIELVVVAGFAGVGETRLRRLSARARQRSAVLLPVVGREPWPGADLELSCAEATWQGPGRGDGRLLERTVSVRARGRGAAARPRRVRLTLPAGSSTPEDAAGRNADVPGVSRVLTGSEDAELLDAELLLAGGGQWAGGQARVVGPGTGRTGV